MRVAEGSAPNHGRQELLEQTKHERWGESDTPSKIKEREGWVGARGQSSQLGQVRHLTPTRPVPTPTL
jgi:hypothetical protein